MKKVLAAVAVAMTLPMTVMAWEPTGDVNVIVAYKAGSGTDTGARLLAVNSFFPQTGNQTIASKLENLIKADVQKQTVT